MTLAPSRYRSTVSATGWTCIFCTTANGLGNTHCSHCGLSLVGGRLADSGPARPRLPRTTAGRPLTEVALGLLLLAIWKLGDIVSGRHAVAAVAHGRAIWHLERRLHLPSEAAVQRPALAHPLLLHALDGYYAAAHVTALVVTAGWLYARHRTSYAGWRNGVLAATATCFAIQLVAVAPPRSVPGLGVQDTARRLGESVYSHARLANQVSSMPSVHMLWALLVAGAVVAASQSRLRWLAVGHPVATLLAIIVTGNHYWLDALAALVIAAPVLAAPVFSSRVTAAVAPLTAAATARR